ncbi:MAG TPA: HNH endonuclease [Daejeonella sp.]|uniref:HNH endonuclease n=1 Tax=Daejeonella sp. TaxID=2805397 RepID=UPI002EDB7A24
MKFYAGATDNSWFNYLSRISPEDVNFWQPGGNSAFKYLQPGEPFLFKLKRPYHVIGGLGFFSSHTFLPLNMAWDVFGEKNGCASFNEFKRSILSYRTDKENSNPTIGCIVLTNPIFFETQDWIPVDQFMSRTGIVQGKGFDTAVTGSELWTQINNTLQKYLPSNPVFTENQFISKESDWPGYGKSVLQKVRIGQSAFRVLVTDAYSRRCSISGEKTLPVLDAAHIKPYNEQGPHNISNGILLRSDMHKLFDTGYITITKDYKVEISKAIKEEFENRREYYQYHGKELLYLPGKEVDKPNQQYIEWHNSIFRG